MKHWWQQDTTEVVKHLNSDVAVGLAAVEAQDRLRRYGPNQLKEAKGRSPVGIFFEQFQDFIVWILISAALVSGFLKEWVDALAIVGIVIVNAILSLAVAAIPEGLPAVVTIALALGVQRMVKTSRAYSEAPFEFFSWLYGGEQAPSHQTNNVYQDKRKVCRLSGDEITEELKKIWEK